MTSFARANAFGWFVIDRCRVLSWFCIEWNGKISIRRESLRAAPRASSINQSINQLKLSARSMPPRSRTKANRDDNDIGTREDDAVSLSVDATNALRATLGLAPLKTERASASAGEPIVDARVERDLAVAELAREELEEKIAQAKARRAVKEANAKTKKLADDDDGGVDAWLAKSSVTMRDKKVELEREKAKKVAAMFAARDADAEDASDESEDEDAKTRAKRAKAAYTSKDLRGLKVRHDAEEIAEGREMVLTLKDASVLDDDAGDELENVLIAEQRARKKARKEATRKGDDPFAEDDGTRAKTVLGKYDEKGEDEGMELDGEGAIDANETKRKEEIKARLAAELAGLKGVKENAEVVKSKQSDYHTQEEMQAKFAKAEKKKKMRKKLRKKHVDAAELEADGLAPATNDLGSRRSRAETGSAVEKEAVNRMEDKNSKFASALQKAREVTDKKILAELAGDVIEDEDEDGELSRALSRSRRMAHKINVRAFPEDVVSQVAGRRLADEAKAKQRVTAMEDAVIFTDMQEFVQGINADVADEGAAHDARRNNNDMPDVPPPPPRSFASMDDAMEEDMPDVPPPPPGVEREGVERDDGDDGYTALPMLAEKHVVKKGLASTLALLKEKAQLGDAQNTRWSGRANDMKDRFDKANVLEAHAVNDDTVDGYKFGFKLDKFDEFGRKLTPKEAFRELCHRFHGIEPGKMKREKRLRLFQEEQTRLKASSSMDAKVKDVQREQATPYVVLSGNISAGQTKQADYVATMKREQAEAKSSSHASTVVRPTSRVPQTGASSAGKVQFSMKSSSLGKSIKRETSKLDS